MLFKAVDHEHHMLGTCDARQIRCQAREMHTKDNAEYAHHTVHQQGHGEQQRQQHDVCLCWFLRRRFLTTHNQALGGSSYVQSLGRPPQFYGEHFSVSDCPHGQIAP